MTKDVGVVSASADSCPLCGQPNKCAMMMPEAERPAECWCVSTNFPESLTKGLDGTRCVCAQCTAAANDTAGTL